MNTDNPIEKNLSQAMEHAAPDVLEHILASAADHPAGQAENVDLLFPPKAPRRRFSALQKGLCTAAALAVCLGVALLSGRLYSQNQTAPDTAPVVMAASVVMLDVNPSFRMDVAADETVASVSALNEDAEAVLGNMKLENISLEVALNALMGSMFQHGYLSDLQNSILVSVENPDTEAGEALRSKIIAAINSSTAESNTPLAVLSQTVNSADASLEAAAKQYQISIGKAALIQEAIDQDDTLTFDSLAGMSINEIALIVASRGLTADTVIQSGTSSTKEYISRDNALSIALQDAGAAADAVLQSKVEFDSEDGILVYEIEFFTAAGEYEYDIDARTGQLLKIEKPNTVAANPLPPLPQVSAAPDGNVPSATPDTAGYIGEAAAKTCALADAGYQETDTVYINAYIDYDDGFAKHYDVEFVVGNTEYEYEIDLYQPLVLTKDVETRSGSHHREPETHHPEAYYHADSTTGYIGEDTARGCALNHSQAAEASITDYECEMDIKNGIPVYEIEFKCGGMEYNYKINALTGAIEKYDMELDD